MEKFKKNWEIQYNWQLIYPFGGILILAYSSYKLSLLFLKNYDNKYLLMLSILLFLILLKITLIIFKKLEKKWLLPYKWEIIRVFLVFAITGTSSIFISRPIIKILGITKENLNLMLYWILYIIIGFIFYQILLVFIGWLLGQFHFFWNFEKKMLSRIGFKRFLEK